jgi:hypothetical protein
VAYPLPTTGCEDGRPCKKLHLDYDALPLCDVHINFLFGSRKKACKENAWCQKERAHPTIVDLKPVLAQQILDVYGWAVDEFRQEEEAPVESVGSIEQYIVVKGNTKPDAKKFGSLDRLVRGIRDGTSSCSGDPYISAFIASPILPIFLEDPLYRLSFNKIRLNHLQKELSEAWAVTQMVRRVLKKLGTAVNDGQGLVIIDMCSGKGLGSALLSAVFPKASVHMIDNNHTMNVPFLQSSHSSKIHFHCCDVHEHEMEERLRTITAAGACSVCAESNSDGDTGVGSRDGAAVFRGEYCTAPVETSSKTTAVMVGTHLCGELSVRLIELFERTQTISALVLAPCCQMGKRDARTKKLARSLRRDPYEIWCMQLLLSVVPNIAYKMEPPLGASGAGAGARLRADGECQQEVGGCGGAMCVSVRSEMLRDAQVLSAKNIYILAVKSSLVRDQSAPASSPVLDAQQLGQLQEQRLEVVAEPKCTLSPPVARQPNR